MGKILAILVAFFGFLLMVDSFTTFQNIGTGMQTTFFNFFEFIVGLVVLGIGIQWYRTTK